MEKNKIKKNKKIKNIVHFTISVVIGIILLFFISYAIKNTGIVGRAYSPPTGQPSTVYSLLQGIQSDPVGYKIAILTYGTPSPALIQAAEGLASRLGIPEIIRIPDAVLENQLIGNERYLIYINQIMPQTLPYSPSARARVDLSNGKVILYIHSFCDSYNEDPYSYEAPLVDAVNVLADYQTYASQLSYDDVRIKNQGLVVPYAPECGETLTKPDSAYKLTGDLYAQSGNCLSIYADNVTIDGNGYNIYCSYNSADGINMQGNNVVVKNLRIDNCYNNLVSSGSNNEIANVSFGTARNLGIAASGTGLTLKYYNAIDTSVSFYDAILNFEDSYGRVEFQKPINVYRKNIKFSDLIMINPVGDIDVNYDLRPEFNKPAILKFYNITVLYPNTEVYQRGNSLLPNYWSILSQDGGNGYYESPFIMSIVGFSNFCIQDSSCNQSVCKDNLCASYYVVNGTWGDGIYFENAAYDGKPAYMRKDGAYWLWCYNDIGGSSYCAIGQCLGICQRVGRMWIKNGDTSNLEGTYTRPEYSTDQLSVIKGALQ